jgi:VIT1/CCC1 family predicted Fe2+/Mn2+ transporter
MAIWFSYSSREELSGDPEAEREELALIYQAKGMSPEEARKLAGRLLDDPEKALDTLSREELGINPEDLGGSAWEAALTSFFLFAGGALLPVFPFLFLSGMHAIAWSVGLSAAGLFGAGAFITLFTGKGWLWSGTRMVLFGAAAAAVTFGVGRLIGAQLGG